MEQISMTLRIDQVTHDSIKVMSNDLGLSMASCLRMILKEATSNYNSAKASQLRKSIMSPESPKQTQEVSTGSMSLTQQDWDALSFDARKPIVQAYRNKSRGNSYDESLEPYFKFVEKRIG